MFCNKKDKHKMTEQQRESYIRWQDYRINHLSFSINLFLGFAIASIGYLTNFEDNIRAKGLSPDARYFLVYYCWLLSSAFGVVATISRLVDFRYTARRIRAGREGYLCLITLAGGLTWVAFGCALVSYFIGLCIFISMRLG